MYVQIENEVHIYSAKVATSLYVATSKQRVDIMSDLPEYWDRVADIKAFYHWLKTKGIEVYCSEPNPECLYIPKRITGITVSANIADLA